MPATHTFTVRLPEAVYKAARRLAAREGVSLNKLVVATLAEKARESTRQRLVEAYELLGEDAAECDAERFIGAQAEALLDG